MKRFMLQYIDKDVVKKIENLLVRGIEPTLFNYKSSDMNRFKILNSRIDLTYFYILSNFLYIVYNEIDRYNNSDFNEKDNIIFNIQTKISELHEAMVNSFIKRDKIEMPKYGVMNLVFDKSEKITYKTPIITILTTQKSGSCIVFFNNVMKILLKDIIYRYMVNKGTIKRGGIDIFYNIAVGRGNYIPLIKKPYIISSMFVDNKTIYNQIVLKDNQISRQQVVVDNFEDMVVHSMNMLYTDVLEKRNIIESQLGNVDAVKVLFSNDCMRDVNVDNYLDKYGAELNNKLMLLCISNVVVLSCIKRNRYFFLDLDDNFKLNEEQLDVLSGLKEEYGIRIIVFNGGVRDEIQSM